MRVLITTLGCKANQADSGSMAALLRERGHEPVAGGDCDAVIINTCAVTSVAEGKSRRSIHALRREHPQALLAVCGCLPAAAGDKLPEADLLGSAQNRGGFIRELEALYIRRTEGEAGEITADPDAADAYDGFERLPAVAGERTRAYLKIQDGCDNYCSYCIIPHTRGAARSLPPAEAVRQAAGLAAQGYRELVLTGIEISSYRPGLPELLRALCAALPGVRLRLGSMEPRVLTAEAVNALAAIPTLCPHFHVSLQSGCDSVLSRMERKYGTADFAASVARLRAAFGDPAVTTDLICGFPGETAEEWARTMAFIERMDFARMHIFPYSRRAGTPADTMAHQVRHTEKQARAAEAAALSRSLTERYHTRQVGRTLEVLFETEKSGVCTGHSGNYLTVSVESRGLRGQIRPILITKADGEALIGLDKTANISDTGEVT